jgi:hypothetical protein
MGKLMEKQIIDAILKHPHISENSNKLIKIKISTLKKYLKKQYYIQLEQHEIIKVIEKYLSDQFIVNKESKPILINKKGLQLQKEKTPKIDNIDKIKVLDNYTNKCPICKKRFKNRSVNLAYYISIPCKENVFGYIEINSLYCPKCREYFTYKKYFTELKRKHLGHVINGIEFSKIKSAYIQQPYHTFKGIETKSKNINNLTTKEVIDEINVIFDCQKKCFCGGNLISKVVSVKSDSRYSSYFDCRTLFCNRCNKYYITKSQYETNKYWIAAKVKFYMPKEKISVERFYHLCNRKYDHLNKESFLHILGYNVSDNKLTLKERLKILDYAILLFGKRRVISHIEYLINDRSNQRDGLNRYKNALIIWKHDLEYVKDKSEYSTYDIEMFRLS